ncbi:VirK/YbjX family protein [Paludibacterium paludis]|uniref:DUF535 domain-containing protein n=1 Tax=Paludibacterium paludis TaxID=1225769 RepID=A0A918P5Z7_9NEIS|nr:VirK/YbjX family protein [Paludibacterium paludis]GGY28593.1 hypothetical protein GCM10011289_34830 [Paludibacterium paludis]
MNHPTPAALLIDLARGRLSRNDGFDEFKHRFKFAFRSLLTLPATLRWLAVLSGNDALFAFLRANPRIACKLHRPYLQQRLSTTGKLAMLTAHYALETERFAPRVLADLLTQPELVLAELTGKDERTYRVTLTHQHTFDKEGELSLQLGDPNGVPLTLVTFTLAPDDTLIIGGLQGPRKQHGPECIKDATKACHGLFPKRVAMEAVTQLAASLGIKRIRAVSKDMHIYNSWRYRKDFEADYDSFWETLDGKRDADGFYTLPPAIPRKAMEDIASKKRSEYQRRYMLMDELGRQLAATLGRAGT